MSDNNLRVAIYARVSSDKQADDGTIASQIEELKARVTRDRFALCDELCFVDDGYSGATLVRPALEKLRDVVALGGVDRLYVHSPDRLARKYAYQVLLVDELRRCGVEIHFLNHSLGTTPEEDLLLQVQGVVAEYERAKIMERSRRGKLHAARAGRVSALGGAPYGYRYVTRAEGGGEARYDVVLDQARVVRKIFDWIGKSRLSISEVRRRLKAESIPSPKGNEHWDQASVWQILKNPAYKGRAAFGKTRTGERRFRLRSTKGHPEQPRKPHSIYDRSSQEWISIEVQAIVSEDVFDAVAEQLEENRKRARQHKRGARYLLQGLLVCAKCARAYCGRAVRSGRSAKDRPPRVYSYYLCVGWVRAHFAGKRVCENGNVRVETLDDAVWKDVRSLLDDPKRIEEEFNRRLKRGEKNEGPSETEEIQRTLQKLRRAIARLIDAYGDGLLEKSEFEPRIRSLKERQTKFEEELKATSEKENQERELRLVMTRIGDFAQKVKDRLEEADWNTRREIIRALVKRIEIDADCVRIVYRVLPEPHHAERVLQHCCSRVVTPVVAVEVGSRPAGGGFRSNARYRRGSLGMVQMRPGLGNTLPKRGLYSLTVLRSNLENSAWFLLARSETRF